jgi:dihydrofolate reductase
MSKRKIVVFDRVSADGYFAAANGDLNWAVPDDAIDQAGVQGMTDTDTMLFGRRTYDMFESFWPRVASDSPTAPDPHAEGRDSPTLRAMANWINEKTKIVFSKTRKEVTWKNSRLVRELDPRQIEAMKNESGKNMIIFGSGSVVSLLTQHGLIDEYFLIVNPIVLGSGKSLISGVPKSTRVDLLEAKKYDSGNVVLRYATRAK